MGLKKLFDGIKTMTFGYNNGGNMEEYRKLEPRKLSPPPEISKRIMSKDKLILPKNKVARFFKLFFGEGF